MSDPWYRRFFAWWMLRHIGAFCIGAGVVVLLAEVGFLRDDSGTAGELLMAGGLLLIGVFLMSVADRVDKRMDQT